MASNTDKWLNYLSPIFLGWFEPAPKNMVRADPWISAVVVFGGWFWSRIGGGQHLRKGDGGAVPALSDPIIGISNGAEATITEAPFLASHGADERQTYRVTPVGAGGVEGDDLNMVREVVIVSNALVPLLPNPPSSLSVSPNKDGTFTLKWRYVPRGQQVAPANFLVFTDQGDGSIDFATEIGTVAFLAGKSRYSLTTVVTAGSNWERWLFVVRSETSTVGHLEQNETVVTVLNSDTAQEDVVDIGSSGPASLSAPGVPFSSSAK